MRVMASHDDQSIASRGAAPRRRAPLPGWIARAAHGLAWRIEPERIARLPALLHLHYRAWRTPPDGLPDPTVTLAGLPGVAGLATDLSAATLAAGLDRGLYPRAHMLRPEWMSPPERALLWPRDLRISAGLRAAITGGRFAVTFDAAFDAVLDASAAGFGRRPPLTWMTPAIRRAYAALHAGGVAHSFEAWDGAGRLAGGGFGVVIGRVFAVEALFHRQKYAARMGFATLVAHLDRRGVAFLDLRAPAAYKTRLGCRTVPRDAFLKLLASTARGAIPEKGLWSVEAGSAEIVAWMEAAAAERASRAPSRSPVPAVRDREAWSDA